MFKKIEVHAAFNDVTGYGIHASNFFPELEKEAKGGNGGTAHISLLDVVTASHTDVRHPAPSILFNVWESTEYPAAFMEKLRLYDQLWVPSEWQKSYSIAQGIPEEFIRVVPEGVNPDVYKPLSAVDQIKALPDLGDTFNFLLVGKWEHRKSNTEICRAFIKAFPLNAYPNVRLYLSCDTLFHCDEYKSTEERLKAYGIEDPRFVVVHFEERAAYIRRLQAAHVFVSCSRAEGWGLPIIEAMACGIPTIVADWSGSTEYAGDALKVRIRELKKPEGIYGNWDVPGQWAEPDYDHLVEVMWDVYKNYESLKEHALEASEKIRTNFSWKRAAEKAVVVLEELSQKYSSEGVVPCLPEAEMEIVAFARQRGYEIVSMKKRKAIFVVDCWPSSEPKMVTLAETINQIHGLGYEVLITSHYALPPHITSLADYYIYEKRDIMSGDDKPIYWRQLPDGTTQQKQATVEYQGVAAINCFRNAIDFCRGKYDWIYQMGADIEVDLVEWLAKVHACDKDLIYIPYEGIKNGFGGGISAGKVDVLDKVIPYLNSWKEYADKYPDVRFVAERWIFRHITSIYDVDQIGWIDCDTSNRFDNVDRSLWDDVITAHFVEGPLVQISGMSDKEYDVKFENPIDGIAYALKQKAGTWSRTNTKFYRDWTLSVAHQGTELFRHTISLKDQRVLVSFGSKALGDTLAWIPYLEEFRKKHGCRVVSAGWWQEIFDYPEIQFVQPGALIEDLYASYEIGCFDNQPDKNPVDWRRTPLQKVAADILGLEYKPVRARLKHQKPKRGNGEKMRPYVCFSEFSTMQNKFWNREGAWQKVINYLVSLGYECISISSEKSVLENITQQNGRPIQETINTISGAEFYFGLNHGPSWIAYSLGVPCIMLTGVSEEWDDFPNPYRISVDVGCKPCFNDVSIPMDRAWNWCHNNDKYACTREITEEMAINMIDKVREDLKCQLQKEDYQEGKSECQPQVELRPKQRHPKKRRPKKGSLTPSSMVGNLPANQGKDMG